MNVFTFMSTNMYTMYISGERFKNHFTSTSAEEKQIFFLFHVFRAIQEKEKYCCGGVFYGDFRKPLIITSPNYPSSYNADMRCPYVFRVSHLVF